MPYSSGFLKLRTVFDYEGYQQKLQRLEAELSDESVWQDQNKLQCLNQEKSQIIKLIEPLDQVASQLAEVSEWLELSHAEQDETHYLSVLSELTDLDKQIDRLSFQQMFSGKNDASHVFLDIQAGSGGTEAQDWAQMLMRMYQRWADQHHMSVQVVDEMPGEVAGIKSATLHIKGPYAYGWLRTETGVHRLVRKSPFDSGNRRHTSFAAVYVMPEIDEDIEVTLNPAELRVDTYRSSGAGGQHVNTTDSAVRITHVPTGLVAQCQSERSQHQNKAQALKQLQSKLYQLELAKLQEDQAAIEAAKSEISWGSQIRSYVLDQSRVKDLRTQVETGDTQKVLDGGLDLFIEACLKQEARHVTDE